MKGDVCSTLIDALCVEGCVTRWSDLDMIKNYMYSLFFVHLYILNIVTDMEHRKLVFCLYRLYSALLAQNKPCALQWLMVLFSERWWITTDRSRVICQAARGGVRLADKLKTSTWTWLDGVYIVNVLEGVYYNLLEFNWKTGSMPWLQADSGNTLMECA